MTYDTINEGVTIAGGGRTTLAGRYRIEDKYSTVMQVDFVVYTPTISRKMTNDTISDDVTILTCLKSSYLKSGKFLLRLGSCCAILLLKLEERSIQVLLPHLILAWSFCYNARVWRRKWATKKN